MVRFISDKEIIFLNALMINKYSPGEQKGVKDEKLLDSALKRPQSSVFGQDAYPSIFEKAAALFSSVCQNHGFHNANKRTGFAATFLFLKLNGFILDTNETEAEEYTLFVVNKKPPIKTIAQWLKRNSKRRP
ncbi:type II toxin-antitoxin system death-on-curing family toxin [Terrilactibacillus laevilacticus]|uniref:Type II toxin-antitoxin system death-on-curing family toxin n=1 Tax=Terrilactibacillus laevilacticus TaxID=1380157 RepID=A0ABW5PM79_9BACI|nr:type II toxin-antitoxin system death-on-curing family toxin [Terrilactibacillus laevilacticus]